MSFSKSIKKILNDSKLLFCTFNDLIMGDNFFFIQPVFSNSILIIAHTWASGEETKGVQNSKNWILQLLY